MLPFTRLALHALSLDCVQRVNTVAPLRTCALQGHVCVQSVTRPTAPGTPDQRRPERGSSGWNTNRPCPLTASSSFGGGPGQPGLAVCKQEETGRNSTASRPNREIASEDARDGEPGEVGGIPDAELQPPWLIGPTCPTCCPTASCGWSQRRRRRACRTATAT